MPRHEIAACQALLVRLQTVYDELKELNGGVAVLHAEAVMVALESHLRKQKAGS